MRAYPISREWLTLLLRRMDAVASIYRLAASMSLGIHGLRSRVEFYRRGRFDATITLHDGRSFGVVRQGLALRRRSLYDRLRAIAEYHYTRRPSAVLILTTLRDSNPTSEPSQRNYVPTPICLALAFLDLQPKSRSFFVAIASRPRKMAEIQ